MIRNYLKYLSELLLLAVIYSNPLIALGATPDKPQTASISLGAEFASGKYGTSSPARSLYMPLIATWSPNDRFSLGIEIPYVYQSSSNITSGLYHNSPATSTSKTTGRGGPGGNSGTNSAAAGSSNHAVSGLGDIILRLGVIALPESTNLPQLRPSLSVKCPTAKASDGLGTGEFDFGSGIEAVKWFGDLHLTGEAFYTWQGKVDSFGLKNYFSYTTGIGYQLTESVEPILILKGATAPSTYVGDLLETRAKVIWSVTDTTTLDLYGSYGIADSSPDYGAGISVIYSF